MEHLREWLILAAIGALGLSACGQPPGPSPVTAPAVSSSFSELVPAPRASAAPPASSSTDADGSAVEAPRMAPLVGPDPKGLGAPCAADSDCGWDDPCVPTRCTLAPDPSGPVACDESALPPGTCHCVSSRCALRPNRAPEPPEPSCAADTCGLDQGAGRCVVGSMLEANRPPLVEGPMCECGARSRCMFVWVDRIECTADADCWLIERPRRHPVRRTAPYRRPFRPCEDGEVLPACVGGFCGFGMGYDC